ncbi:MAG: hypothetical protein L3J06_01070 [Cyclobacteriaceae bacterium]|nr:hypothetical protein [Cyclobacteriaceae bacterium]
MVICIFTLARPLAGGQQRNENDDDINVYFDNLTITHTGLQACPPVAQRRRIVESTDYYPYGMLARPQRSEGGVMPARLTGGRKETPSQGQGIYNPYRYGYQGQYSEFDPETSLNHFELRQYGSRIGRWTATDPYRQYYSPYVGMGNNPVSRVDPDGGFTCDTCPKNAKYDVYRNSSWDWSYSSLAGGDGAFLMMNNVDVFDQNGGSDDVLISHLNEKHSNRIKNYLNRSTWTVDIDEEFTGPGKGRNGGNVWGKTKGVPEAKTAKVYIHPSVLKDKNLLFLVMGHELVHVSHHISGSYQRWIENSHVTYASALSEYHAWNWTYDQGGIATKYNPKAAMSHYYRLVPLSMRPSK